MSEEAGYNGSSDMITSDRLGHVMLIPDGHRRYADKHGISTKDAYLSGAKIGLRLVDLFDMMNIREVTYYLVSTRTLSRDKEAVNDIFFALDNFLHKLTESLRSGHLRFQVYHYGDRSLLPANTVTLIDQLVNEDLTFPRRLNLLIGYSGTQSLLQMARALSGLDLGGAAISESRRFDELLRNSERCLSKIDLVLRTGEFFRLSDAPLLETLNSCFVLIPKLFPEIEEWDVRSIIERYKNWAACKKGITNELCVS